MNIDVGNYSFEVTWDKTCVGLNSPHGLNFTAIFEENVAYQLFTDENNYNVHTVSLIRLYFKLFSFLNAMGAYAISMS